MNNRVIWEKWLDPFLSNADDFDPIKSNNDNEEEDEDDTDDKNYIYKDSFQRYEQDIKSLRKEDKPEKKTNAGPVIIGPMGIIPINENNTPTKIYCFWLGHTNFDVTEKVAYQIENTVGVESLDVFTRYRFRIAIGKAFLNEKNDPFGREILKDIEKAIIPKEVKQEKVDSIQVKKDNLNLLKKHLKSRYSHWAIFLLPDGQYDLKGGEDKEQLEKEVLERGNSTLATSWE